MPIAVSQETTPPLNPKLILMRKAIGSSVKFYGFLICIVFGVVFVGRPAGAQEAGTAEFPILFDTRERIAKPDLSGIVRLRFLTTVDFPPFNFIDQQGKLAGFHVDLVREICRELDIAAKCQVQAIPFEELGDALKDGNGEAVIAGMAVDAALRRDFAFSRPFMRLPARFAVRKAARLSAESASALDGRAVGVVAGTVHEAMLKTYFPAVRPEPMKDRATLLAALKDGKVDAAFSDGMQLAFWMAGSASAACCRLFDGPYLSETFLGEGLTVMTRKEDTSVVAAVDHALLALSRNGRLGEIYLRYFPVDLF